MRRLTGFLIALCALLATTIPVRAQPEDARPLTKQLVKGFLDAMPELEAWGNENEHRFDTVEESADTDDFSSFYETFVSSFEGVDVPAEMRAILKRHGFDSIESWADAGARTMQAYFALKYELSAPERNGHMKEALEQIENSGMSDEQKDAMRQLLTAGDEAMKSFSQVSKADKDAVRPFLGRIDEMGEVVDEDE